MRNFWGREAGSVVVLAWALAACGGGAASEPPPQAGKNATAGAGSATPAEPSSGDAGIAPRSEATSQEPAKTEPAKTEMSPSASGSKPSRHPHDILTQPDTLFMLSFDDSDASKAAEVSCAKPSGNDPKKMANCMSAARLKIEADGHGFKKDKDGNLVWVVIHRKGSTVSTIHKIRVEFGTETDNTIVIKPQGKDTGTSPGRVPGDFTIEVPSDYRIVLTDPRFGKLVYEAKIGIVKD